MSGAASFGEQALAELDMLRMRVATDHLQHALGTATCAFATSQAAVPTMWVALLACLAQEVATNLEGLRHIPEVRAQFDGMLTDMQARVREGRT